MPGARNPTDLVDAPRPLSPETATCLVDAPRPLSPETATWDAAEVASVLKTAAGDELEALWRLAVTRGMRRGELLGLKWQDVDLERGVVAVRRTLSRGKGGAQELGPPKSARGRRSIAFPPSAVEGLKRHRERQLAHRLALGAAWQDADFVFANATGGPLRATTLVRRFAELVARAGMPRIRFHDLRHTSATVDLARGIHPKIVQERLGHASIGMTLDRYSHVTMDMQRDAADGLDAAIADAAHDDDPPEDGLGRA